jgi:signal transduction histidine kinase/CheY-like chemotaxis protein
MKDIMTVSIRFEHDVVLARQRARQIAALLGFENQDQVRIATAVSEIARNVYQYGGGGKALFGVSNSAPQRLQIRLSDTGAGIPHLLQILDGQYTSRTGMGMGILGARRLMDEFDIQSEPGKGTTVLLGRQLPRRAPPVTPAKMAEMAGQLAHALPRDPFEELQRQNQELLATLAELEKRQTELGQLNKELEDTNRGVVALYAELDEKADYLRRASELKTQFLSNMTHEFRTPLNSILSLGRLLLDRVDGDLTPEQERQVRFIQKAAEDLSELVNDLLDLAKVEAGKIVIRPQDFEVADLFGALRGMLRPLLMHNSSVNLVFEEPQGVQTLETDESKVSQILRNLLSNALKYTERGEVRVRAWQDDEKHVVFSVTDTGVGIAPGDQERIFEEFTQVEGPHQVGKKGTGLGLPLSRKLAELLGGRLTVKSEVGQGSVFCLRIPAVYVGREEVSFAPDIDSTLDPTRRPVLVVEDNRETLLMYEKFLKGTGFQPIPARTLKQARLALEHFNPVAVVLDVLLNHENTWAFLSDLKGRAQTKQIPVYVVTMVENEHKARALGADDFHTKPLERQWLISRLEALATRSEQKTLLMIDDDEVSRYVLGGLLSETRFRQIEAPNGAEGLRLAREQRPAAIFLDLMMPGLSGFEVLDQLKADPVTAGIPIIIHTAKVVTEEDQGRLSGRVTGIIPKAHTDRQLSLTRIREMLVQAGVASPLEREPVTA